MSSKRQTQLRFLLVFVVLGGLGISAVVYTLIKQRISLPFRDTYDVQAQFSAADGVVSGLGQPVDVAGVGVGEVVGARLQNGQALVTLQIDHSQLAHVYANASAVLEPITPLEDMEIDLDPGSASAGPLPAGATIGIGQTTAPVPLSDLLSSLDTDTRAFLGSLITSVGQGTADRGSDIRRMLAALGPTAADVAQISRALAARRAELAQLVHNLATVTGAASEDRQLAAVVVAGDETVHAIADEDGPLRDAIGQLPGTLAVTHSTLVDLEPFASALGPTLDSLEPSVSRLPNVLGLLARFANVGTPALAHGVRPLVSAAGPLVSKLVPTVSDLKTATPYLSGSFQVLEYLVNELAYNPGGNDQGFLFWIPWFVHNFNSMTSFADANGGIGRATPLLTCYGLQSNVELQKFFGVVGLCPK